MSKETIEYRGMIEDFPATDPFALPEEAEDALMRSIEKSAGRLLPKADAQRWEEQMKDQGGIATIVTQQS